MRTAPATDNRILRALERMNTGDAKHLFGHAVETALALWKYYDRDWEAVAARLDEMPRSWPTKVSLPFTAVKATITGYLWSEYGLMDQVAYLTAEIERRENVDLSSAWCGEQDHFGDVTDQIRRERDGVVARLTAVQSR